ncbi:MAG: hypothetical protein Q9187_002356 [Circinaria calcarea]
MHFAPKDGPCPPDISQVRGQESSSAATASSRVSNLYDNDEPKSADFFGITNVIVAFQPTFFAYRFEASEVYGNEISFPPSITKTA